MIKIDLTSSAIFLANWIVRLAYYYFGVYFLTYITTNHGKLKCCWRYKEWLCFGRGRVSILTQYNIRDVNISSTIQICVRFRRKTNTWEIIFLTCTTNKNKKKSYLPIPNESWVNDPDITFTFGGSLLGRFSVDRGSNNLDWESVCVDSFSCWLIHILCIQIF